MYRNLVTFLDYFNSNFRDLLSKKSLNLWRKVSKFPHCAKCHTKQKGCCDHFFGVLHVCKWSAHVVTVYPVCVHGCGPKIIGWVP